jgi:hypothetical protein
MELAVLVFQQFGHALLVARQRRHGDGGTDGAGVTVGGGSGAQRRQGPAYRQTGVGKRRIAGCKVQRFGIEQYAVQSRKITSMLMSFSLKHVR